MSLLDQLISGLRAQKVDSLVGYMGLHLPEDFVRGVAGVMPTLAVCPALVEIWHLLELDPLKARRLHQELLPLLIFMMQSVEFLLACEKELLVRGEILRSAFRREPAFSLDVIQQHELEAHANRLNAYLAHRGHASILERH